MATEKSPKLETDEKTETKEDEEPTSTENVTEDKAEVTVEGRHMTVLRKAVDKTVDKCVSVGRFSMFAKNHPTLARKNTKALQSIHKQYQNNLRKAIQTEVETMFQEERMPELMNELDRLISEVPAEAQHKQAWRPSGDPATDLAHCLVPIKLKQRDRLSRLVAQIEDDNARLMKAVTARRHTVGEMSRQVEERTERLAKITEDLPMQRINTFLEDMAHVNNC